MATRLVSDALWSLFAPLLPPQTPGPKGGRPPLDNRAALTGLLFVLKSGLPWAMLPQEMGCGSGMTCWRRLRDWLSCLQSKHCRQVELCSAERQSAGIWQAFHPLRLNLLGRAGVIDWSRCALDSASLAAKGGGEQLGPNPTDRGKPGAKRHIVVDRPGIPLVARLSAANVHDSLLLEAVIDGIPPIRQRRGRPRHRPSKLHADKAFDFPRCRKALRHRRIIARMARRGIDSSERLGRHRWGVERTLSWIARFRRLTIRYERRADIHLAFLVLACALICVRFLQRFC